VSVLSWFGAALGWGRAVVRVGMRRKAKVEVGVSLGDDGVGNGGDWEWEWEWERCEGTG